MKICLSCKGEYLDQIEECGTCNEPLVTEEEALMAPSKETLLSKEELFESEMLPFTEGGISQCRDVEKILAAANISCAVYPLDLKAADNVATIGSASDKKYLLLIRAEDVDLAKKAMEGQFSREVAKEGKGAFSTEAIDLSNDTVLCPACGEQGPLNDGECSNCGLFLGVSELETQKLQ